MRVFTAACIASVSLVAFFVGRRYWRDSPYAVIAGLALSAVFVSVLRIDAYVLSAIQVTVTWDLFWFALVDHVVWAALCVLLVGLLRRTPWLGLVAVFGVVAVAYTKSVVATAVLDRALARPGTPWTDYWESILGGVVVVNTGGDYAIGVHFGGWWPTIATALVAGCTLAARRVPKAAHSPELAS